MNKNLQQEEMLIRNLQDAGCPQNIVEQFMENYHSRNTFEQIRILSEHRIRVLGSVHEEQSKLDCLDYLLYQMKKSATHSTSQENQHERNETAWDNSRHHRHTVRNSGSGAR